jgi:hypothetical protein
MDDQSAPLLARARAVRPQVELPFDPERLGLSLPAIIVPDPYPRQQPIKFGQGHPLDGVIVYQVSDVLARVRSLNREDLRDAEALLRLCADERFVLSATSGFTAPFVGGGRPGTARAAGCLPTTSAAVRYLEQGGARMKAPTTVALVMWFASLAACTDGPESELAKVQQAEIIEVTGCRPGTLGNGEVCIDPLEGGGDGGGGGPTGGEGGPSGPGGGGGGGGGGAMDPEPDRNKDRKSCHHWCDWSYRQCEKWCRKEYPDPHWNKRNRCFKDRCENDPDPNIGSKKCAADCNSRFPERPITALEPA